MNFENKEEKENASIVIAENTEEGKYEFNFLIKTIRKIRIQERKQNYPKTRIEC